MVFSCSVTIKSNDSEVNENDYAAMGDSELQTTLEEVRRLEEQIAFELKKRNAGETLLLAAEIINRDADICLSFKQNILQEARYVAEAGKLSNGRRFSSLQHAVSEVQGELEDRTRGFARYSTQRYKAFLFDILSSCGRGAFLLSAAVLGKDRIGKMSSRDRDTMIEFFKSGQAYIDSDKLRTYAKTTLPETLGIYIIRKI